MHDCPRKAIATAWVKHRSDFHLQLDPVLPTFSWDVETPVRSERRVEASLQELVKGGVCLGLVSVPLSSHRILAALDSDASVQGISSKQFAHSGL